MDSEDVLPAYGKAVAEVPDLRKKPSEGRGPTIARAEEPERMREVGSPAPAMGERTPAEAGLRRIVEAGGGVFIGVQERVGGKPSLVQVNDPEAKTKSTISIDPEVEEVTAETVRRRIEEKRRAVPAKEKKPGYRIWRFTRGI